ncbi:MAG: transglutaminase-like domain-containing protein, partial [Polyangiaceae bacterium]
GETSEATFEHAKARGVTANAKESDVLAAIAIIADEASVAGHGVAAAALEEIAKSSSPWDEARAEARVVARAIADDEGTKAGTVADSALGIVTDASIVGPFRDTGGGLARREGPEEKGAKLSDPNANWSWGSVDVRWRTASSDASGVDLDLLIEPRKESCSIVTTTVTLEKETSFVVRLAATGQARLAIDGVDAGSSEDASDSALFDRIAARADKAPTGTHTVLAKVCTGAMSDDGRVRLRITDDKGARLEAKTTADRTEPPMKAPHVTKLGTPLSRALAAKGDADTQLAVAALRTFGGADDARSPRAAGILDAVVHGLAPADADRLAMAGWLATSGANRSGWLNEARARAEKAGDNEIGAFCTRRLAAERFNARLADWAQATMANVTGNDAEAVALRAEIKSGLGSEALRLEAFHELVSAVDAAPDRASDAMLEQLAKVASGIAPARETTTRIALAKRGERDSAYVASIRERGKAVLAAIETFDAGPSDAGDAVDIVNVVLANGDPKSGTALAERLATMAPNRADVWTTLADALAALQRTPKVAAEMTAALERARMLAPGDARTKGLLALGDKSKSATAGDEHYLVDPQVFLAKRQGVPKPGVAPEVADRELYWLRAVVMHPDKRVSQLIQYAREIVIPPRTQEELVEELPAEGDLTEILRARVYRKGGGTAFPVEEHDEGSRPHVRWPDLEPGDVVEVALRTWTATAVGGRGDAPFYFVDYAGAPSTHPLLYNEVNVESSKDHPLYVDVVHGNADKREERDVGNVHVTRLVWNKPVMVAEEPLSPAMSEIVPVIVGSTFKSWSDFREWYAQAVQGFTEPDDQVRRLAAELTKGKSSRADKVRAIFDFVSDDIRYVNYVSGEWWLPNRPQQLLARREGDC